MRVKVCGITRLEDALACYESGVHALGFNFYRKSPRYIQPSEAREIISRLPPWIHSTGVFVNEANPGEVEDIARIVGLNSIQLHGDESPEYCRNLGAFPLIKAFRVGPDFSVHFLSAFPVSMILLDGLRAGEFGGTGHCCDWELAASIAGRYPTVLSGGLTPLNVEQAIRQVRPSAVDVCSGVESGPGIKSRDAIRMFMESVFRTGTIDPGPQR